MRLANQNTIPAVSSRRNSIADPPLNSIITSLMGQGDSIMVGQNCGSPGFDPNSGTWDLATDSFYNQLLNAYPSFTSNDNKGSRGAGMMRTVYEAILDVSYGLSRKAYLIFSGYNDYRNLGVSTTLANRINDCYRSVMALHCLKNWKCGDQYSARSNATHWNTTFFNPINYRTRVTTGHFIAQKTSGGTSAWIEYTFSGNGVVVGLGKNYQVDPEGVWFDIVDIYVDGNLIDTVNPKRETGTPFGWEVFNEPFYVMYTGFGAGSHTIRIQCDTVRSGVIAIDGIGEIHDSASDFQPLISMHTMRMKDPEGYAAGGTTLDNGSDAAADQVNAEIDSVSEEFNLAFPGMFRVFETNNHISALTDFHADLIHPKRVGHDNIATGLINFFNQ